MYQKLTSIFFLLLILFNVYSFKIGSEKALGNDQKSANFNETQLQFIRTTIHKAQKKYAASFESISSFIQDQMNNTYPPSHWNVVVYRKVDWYANFYLTGMPDEYHQNKRYFQSVEPEGFNFSVLIL